MTRVMIGDLKSFVGQTVTIQGWVQTIRDQKKMQFLVVRDTTGLVQVVLEKSSHLSLATQVSSLIAESCITAIGIVVENPVVKLGGLELQLLNIQVENLADSPIALDPFAENLASIDYRMDWRYLDLRRPENLLIFKVQTLVEMAMREYWLNNRFIEIHSPKLMGSPSESGAELFELPYFGSKAYLAQSPQFYKQMAMSAGFERVFEIGPVFRADPSFTSRHMTEFISVDAEISWIASHEEIMALMEDWLLYIYQRLAMTYGLEIHSLFGVDIIPPETPFPRMSMEEAMIILNSKEYHLPPERRGDIDPGGERILGQYIKEKYNHDFFFLTDWPAIARPFYHMRHSAQPQLTCSFDLIAKGLEISTGAQREHRYDILTQQALEKGLSLENIQFYLDFFKFGCPPHGGFGFGLARFLMILLGIGNIRETVFLFRGPTRLHP